MTSTFTFAFLFALSAAVACAFGNICAKIYDADDTCSLERAHVCNFQLCDTTLLPTGFGSFKSVCDGANNVTTFSYATKDCSGSPNNTQTYKIGDCTSLYALNRAHVIVTSCESRESAERNINAHADQ